MRNRSGMRTVMPRIQHDNDIGFGDADLDRRGLSAGGRGNNAGTLADRADQSVLT